MHARGVRGGDRSGDGRPAGGCRLSCGAPELGRSRRHAASSAVRVAALDFVTEPTDKRSSMIEADRALARPHVIRITAEGIKRMKTVLVTGSSGLIGSEAVTYFDRRGWRVAGVDNNMPAGFFGPKGDTTWNLNRLRAQTRNFTSVAADIRHRAAMKTLNAEGKPDLIGPAAAQPRP